MCRRCCSRATTNEVKSGRAKKKLFRFALSHSTSIAEKVSVIVEHYREHVSHLLGGQAKAMIVTDSRGFGGPVQEGI